VTIYKQRFHFEPFELHATTNHHLHTRLLDMSQEKKEQEMNLF